MYCSVNFRNACDFSHADSEKSLIGPRHQYSGVYYFVAVSQLWAWNGFNQCCYEQREPEILPGLLGYL